MALIDQTNDAFSVLTNHSLIIRVKGVAVIVVRVGDVFIEHNACLKP
jgi:hypothetical protein